MRMFVSSVNLPAAFMQRVPVEGFGVHRPALLHDLAEMREGVFCFSVSTRTLETGLSRATGLPLRVMMKSSPDSTARMQLENCWLASEG